MDTAAPNSEPGKARIFISYSRRDSEFVDRLTAGLRALGYQPFIDRTDIAAGEDWKSRLDELILQSDVMVFVLSEASAASPICEWETGRALELGKRLIPVCYGSVLESAIPSHVSRLNYVRLGDGPALDEGIATLARACDVDINWIREHSRLTARAEEWARATDGAKESKLLRTGEVEAAEAWMRLRPAASAPKAPEILLGFIELSKQHEAAQRDRLLTITGRAFVKPARQAHEAGFHDAALRQTAAGTILGEDLLMRLVPERGSQGLFRRAAFTDRTQAILLHSGETYQVAYSGPRKRIVSVSCEGVHIWSGPNAEEEMRLPTSEPVSALVIAEDEARILFVEGQFGPTRLFDGLSGAELLALKNTSRSTMSRNGKRIAGVNFGQIMVWDADTGAEVTRIESGGLEVLSLDLSSDGTRLITLFRDGAVRLWDSTAGALITQANVGLADYAFFSNDASAVITNRTVWSPANGDTRQISDVMDITSLWTSPDTTFLIALIYPSKTVRIYETKSLRKVVEFESLHDVQIACMSPDNKLIALIKETDVYVWDVAAKIEIIKLTGHVGEITGVAFSQDGCSLITSALDKTVRVWDVSPARMIARIPDDGAEHRPALCDHAGRLVARIIATGGSHTKIWNLETGGVISQFDRDCIAVSPVANHYLCDDGAIVTEDGALHVALQEVEGGFLRAAFDRQGMRVAIRLSRGRVGVWDTISGARVSVIVADRLAGIFAPDYTLSSDGRYLMTYCNSDNRMLRVWEVSSGTEIFAIQLPYSVGAHCPASFAPMKSRIVVGSEDAIARVYDYLTGDEILCLRADLVGPAKAVCFSPDGSRVATSAAGCVIVWDAESGQPITRPFDTLSDNCLFSPDGGRLATSSGSNLAVWDAHSGDLIAEIEDSHLSLQSMQFSPDGRRIIVARTGETTGVWDVSRTEALAGPAAPVLAAGLRGKGKRLENEYDDLLMRAAPDDLYRTFVEALSVSDHADATRRSASLAECRAPLWFGEALRHQKNTGDIVVSLEAEGVSPASPEAPVALAALAQKEDVEREGIARTKSAILPVHRSLWGTLAFWRSRSDST